MTVRFKLGRYETVRDDPLGREFVGYFPRMTESEAWETGRGVWRMSTDKASRQRFALVVGEGVVRAVGEITGWSVHGDRIALEGHVLPAGHPLRETYLNQPDPVENSSQNPVGYCTLPEEAQFVQHPCACGCSQLTDRDYLPGHDVRAMQARVRGRFDGSARSFLDWVDTTVATIPVRLLDGPLDGQVRDCGPRADGIPEGQLVFAVRTDAGATEVVNYWRRVEPERDDSWVAEFYPGTTTPPDWIERITVRD
jgi:hypothetical protein